MQNKIFIFIFIFVFVAGALGGYLCANRAADAKYKERIELAEQTNSEIRAAAERGCYYNWEVKYKLEDSIREFGKLNEGNNKNKNDLSELKVSVGRVADIIRQIEDRK